MSSVLIFGGTSGIGREIGRYYADAGHRATLTGRDADRGRPWPARSAATRPAFLLRNPAVNGVSLNIDGGTLLG
jgi:NAD(P)-dependent dehydrogenase (short-subunit alcohol dehydrogenase family)